MDGPLHRSCASACRLISSAVQIFRNNTTPWLSAHVQADRLPTVPHSSDEVLRASAHFAMGTRFSIYLACADEAEADACFRAVFEEIDRLENTFSRFRPGSEISRLNRDAPLFPVTTDPEVFQLLVLATDVSRRTQGAFDITCGRVTRAWRAAAKSSFPVNESDWRQFRASAGWEKLLLDPVARTVQFANREVELDLGAIAKGYAVDCAIDLLESIQVDGIIDAGSSSIAAAGGAVDWQWTVELAHPFGAPLPVAQLALEDRAISTSGTKEQSFQQDGRTYSHLVDLMAQEPFRSQFSTRVLQTTVLAPTSTMADALSAAMFLLGPERGCTALEQFENCSALWILQEGKSIAFSCHRWPGQIPQLEKEQIWTDVISLD